MAEQYQLPPEFRAPSMAETAYRAGDTQAQEQETMNNFLRQWNTATNIDNANRLMSMREKQFAQEIIDKNRDFDLRSKMQDVDIRNKDLQYEISNFGFRKAEDDYAKLQEAYTLYPSINKQIQEMLPNGSRIDDWQKKRSEIRSIYATNPQMAVFVDQILNGYDVDNKIYQDNGVGQSQANMDSMVKGGYFTDYKFDDEGKIVGSSPVRFGPDGLTADQYWKAALLDYQNGDFMAYNSKLNELRTVGENRKKFQENLQTIEQQKILQKQAGVPFAEIKITEKGGVESELRPPRIYAGAGGTAATPKPLTEASLKQLITDLDDNKAALESAKKNYDSAENELDRQRAEREILGLTEKIDRDQAILDQNKGAMQYQINPQGAAIQGAPSGARPATQPSTLAPRPNVPRPGLKAPTPPPVNQAPTSAPAPAPVSEPSMSMSPEAKRLIEAQGVKVQESTPARPSGMGRRVRTQEELSQEKVSQLRAELEKLGKQRSGRSGTPNVLAMKRVAEDLVSEQKKLDAILLAKQKQASDQIAGF